MKENEEKKSGKHNGEDVEAHLDDHKKKKKKDDVIDELKDELDQKEDEIKELKERTLYLQAEFENFKKMKNKEKQDILRYANETLVKELLPVVDNLDRALEHASKTDDTEGIKEGVQLTLNEFLKVLEKSGVTRIEALGTRFDPNFHEAFSQEARDDVEPDTIVSEYQKGYLLNGRLVRPSMVIISKKPEES